MSTTTLSTPLRTPSIIINRKSNVKNVNLDKVSSIYDNVPDTCPCESRKTFDELYSHPQVVQAFGNICFIAALLQSRDKETKSEEDWKYVAMVLDRLFLLIFACACFLGTVGILLQAPTLYDDAQPIDMRSTQLAEQPKMFMA